MKAREFFLDPSGSNRAEVEELFRSMLTLVIDIILSSPSRSPVPDLPSGELFGIPRERLEPSAMLERLPAIFKQAANMHHPGYLGHMDPPPSIYSVVGEFATAMFNNNMLSVEMSPIFSRMERELLKGVAAQFGLPEGAGGVLLSGGTLANLEALAVARNRALECAEHGMVHVARKPVLFCSEAVHSSIDKAAMLLGLGKSAVIRVPVDEAGKMRVDALRQAIHDGTRRGDKPFCVVGTAGTTATGNIDPLSEIAEIAAQNALWFHVDAAFAGALAFSEKHAHRLDGIARADSITFNPQKWFCVTKASAMVLFRRVGDLDRFFRIPAPYMSERNGNLGEISVQGTRSADVLKLWLAFSQLGREGMDVLLDEAYERTPLMLEGIRARPALELATEPETNIICFRARFDGRMSSEEDERNRAMAEFLHKERKIFLSLPCFRGKRWLKAVLINPFTDAEVFRNLFDGIDTFLASSR